MKVLLAFLVNALFNFAIGLIVARFLGPEEYGRFALALALTVVVQTAVFDWIRLAAIRFYSERSRADTPEVRATLDVSFCAAGGRACHHLRFCFAVGCELRLVACAGWPCAGSNRCKRPV